jgi:hypothetical protein
MILKLYVILHRKQKKNGIADTSVKMAVRQAHGPERSRRAEKKRKWKTNLIAERSDSIIRCSMLDVRCSMFSLYVERRDLMRGLFSQIFLQQQAMHPAGEPFVQIFFKSI